ncbi:MAG TPA: hypothetical protein P5536_01080 [Methanoregulaceae archaeon]|nr:hypothetical protein [Methanoregulaceae archaeon]
MQQKLKSRTLVNHCKETDHEFSLAMEICSLPDIDVVILSG